MTNQPTKQTNGLQRKDTTGKSRLTAQVAEDDQKHRGPLAPLAEPLVPQSALAPPTGLMPEKRGAGSKAIGLMTPQEARLDSERGERGGAAIGNTASGRPRASVCAFVCLPACLSVCQYCTWSAPGFSSSCCSRGTTFSAAERSASIMRGTSLGSGSPHGPLPCT
jgi:hypothetical protein